MWPFRKKRYLVSGWVKVAPLATWRKFGFITKRRRFSMEELYKHFKRESRTERKGDE